MRIPLRFSLAKTASFAVLHFLVAFTVAYLLTGSVGIAGALALLEPLANTVAYFFHERAWLKFAPRAAGLAAVPDTRLASASK
jgi:uncharacterized membrane protein